MTKVNPLFLIEHIEKTHGELLNAAAEPLERLENLSIKPLIFDTAIWFTSKDYLSIITTNLFDENPLESTFSIGVHGKIFRSAIKGGKYKEMLDLKEVDSLLAAASEVAQKTKWVRDY